MDEYSLDKYLLVLCSFNLEDFGAFRFLPCGETPLKYGSDGFEVSALLDGMTIPEGAHLALAELTLPQMKYAISKALNGATSEIKRPSKDSKEKWISTSFDFDEASGQLHYLDSFETCIVKLWTRGQQAPGFEWFDGFLRPFNLSDLN